MLLYLEQYEEGSAQAIANTFERVALSQVQRQLERLEAAGLLVTAVRDGMSLEELAALVCATLERHGFPSRRTPSAAKFSSHSPPRRAAVVLLVERGSKTDSGRGAAGRSAG